jgi:hypothetical protein
VLSVHSGASRPQGVARGGGAAAAAGAANGDVASDSEPPIDEKTLKRFIKYCRSHCFPRLEEQSAGRLVAKYVELRDKVSRSCMSSNRAQQGTVLCDVLLCIAESSCNIVVNKGNVELHDKVSRRCSNGAQQGTVLCMYGVV